MLKYDNIKFPDNLLDIKRKKKFFGEEFRLNPRGISVLEQTDEHPVNYLHKQVKLMTAPYLDFDVNVWFIKRRDEWIIIDTSAEYSHLQEGLTHYQIEPTHVLLTHQHADHHGGYNELCSAHPKLNHSPLKGVRKISTPGHCAEHISYYFPDEGVCFCGDALFAASIGKPNYSVSESLKSLRALLTLPPETLLFPGHGAATSVAWEREHNCFFSPCFHD